MHTPAPWSTANTCSNLNCHVCKLHPTAECVRAQYQLQKLQEKPSWNVRVIRRQSDKRQNCNPPMAAHTKRRKHQSHTKPNTRIAELVLNSNTGNLWPRKRKKTRSVKHKNRSSRECIWPRNMKVQKSPMARSGKSNATKRRTHKARKSRSVKGESEATAPHGR